MRIGRACWQVLALVSATVAVAGCASGGSAAGGNTLTDARPLGPFYGVPQDMMRPDGTMLNRLLPINPDNQS